LPTSPLHLTSAEGALAGAQRRWTIAEERQLQMTCRIQLFSKLLLAFFVACTLAILAAWAILLTTICSNPRTPMPETQHVIPYNCHGMTVFISHLENAMLHWLIPLEGLFIFLSLVAAAMVILAHAKVRINVQIHPTDASSSTSHREGGRD
jgi:hypothetical protein